MLNISWYDLGMNYKVKHTDIEAQMRGRLQ